MLSMMSIFFSLWVCCYLVSLVASLSATEFLALNDLYVATNGDDWTWLSPFTVKGYPWNFTDSSDPCSTPWQGITCVVSDAISHVTELNFSGNNMIGTLPNSLGNLTELQLLHLTFNDLYGTIPRSIGDLPKLEVLELFRNSLNGTIPSLSKLLNLATLALGSNQLTGSIPDVFEMMQNLTALRLGRNGLTGTIPSSIGNLAVAQEITLGNNLLTGTIPDTLGNLTDLRVLALSNNFLNGTIPASLHALTHLSLLALSHNAFTGSIPDIFDQMEYLKGLNLFSNILRGPIPSSVFGSKMVEVLLQENQLTGSIPDTICSAVALRVVNVSNNILTGTIPASVGKLQQLDYFVTTNNRITGSIPDSMGKLTLLRGLYLRKNLLTGSIPVSFQNLTSLETLDLQENMLEGPLTHVFQPTQINLLNVQLNGNPFTGELPTVLFQLPHLSSLGISSACLHGTFPDNICESTELITLVLYGLSTGAACTSTAERSFEGTLPRCLLTLPKIRTLLLSSNQISDTMSDDWVVNNQTLIQLDLCHNQLRGVIPSAIQNRSWSLLDLSHNKFSGTVRNGLDLFYYRNLTDLTSSVQNSENDTVVHQHFDSNLSLEVNRLSGKVPNSVKTMRDLSVLAGNLFQCYYDKTDLPQHDSDIETYECASNSFNMSIYFLLGAVAGSIGLWYVFFRMSHKELHLQPRRSETSSLPHTVSHILTLYSLLCKTAGYCTAFCLLVLLPYYVLISHFSGTHTHQYAYAVSAIFTSGVIPFVLTTVLLSALLYIASLFNAFQYDVRGTNNAMEKLTNWWQLSVVWAVFAFTNIVAVLGVNILFVYIVLYQSSEAQTVAQVALSVFKLVWSVEVSPYMMRYLDAYYFPHDSKATAASRPNYFTLQLLVSLFNNIAIPCLVVLSIDPNCFSAALSPPLPETVEYILTTCNSLGFTSECTRREFRTESFQFTPSFKYSYQCSASFITHYAPAFAYMAISSVFLSPLGQYTLLYIRNRNASTTLVHKAASWPLPRLLKPPTAEALELYHSQTFRRPLLGATSVLVTLFTQFGILLTFGAIFPPVALAMAVSIAAVVYLTRFKVQRFVQAAVDAQLLGYLDVINAECAGVGTREQIQLAVKIIVCYCCAFYTLFLFDTLGDAEGFAASAWVLFLLPLAPTLFFSTNVVNAVKLSTSSGAIDAGMVGVELAEMSSIPNKENPSNLQEAGETVQTVNALYVTGV